MRHPTRRRPDLLTCYYIAGATALTIPIGHFLTVLTDALGDFAEVSALGAIQTPTATLLDAEGKPTGKTIQKTIHDQVALNGILESADGQPGVFVNIHIRAGLPFGGEHGRGRKYLEWIIDGEKGTIEVQNDPKAGIWGAIIQITDKLVFLNGKPVTWEKQDVDRLDNTGKAWLEFAKGEQGKYWGIDESVRVHRVMDAVHTSIATGKKVVL